MNETPEKNTSINGSADLETLLRDEAKQAVNADDYSRAQLAKDAGVSAATVHNLCEKKGSLNKTSRRKLAAALRRRNPDFKWGDEEPEARFALCANPACPTVRVAYAEGHFYVAPKFRPIKGLVSDKCPYCRATIHVASPCCNAPISERQLLCPKPGCKGPLVPAPKDLENLPPTERVRACVLRNRMNDQLMRHLADDAS